MCFFFYFRIRTWCDSLVSVWCTFLYVLEHAQLTREMKAVMEVSFFLFISILWFYMKNSSVCATVNINGYFLFPSWSCDQPPVQGCVVHSFFFCLFVGFFFYYCGSRCFVFLADGEFIFLFVAWGSNKIRRSPPHNHPTNPPTPWGTR